MSAHVGDGNQRINGCNQRMQSQSTDTVTNLAPQSRAQPPPISSFGPCFQSRLLLLLLLLAPLALLALPEMLEML